MIILFVSLQDGSVEYGIPSTQLYPIHHLDDQEFFPGDFVIENKEEGCMRVYGVVQSVDHAGRTATVKWFKTYTSQEEPWLVLFCIHIEILLLSIFQCILLVPGN
jgi:ubiquitin-conjugating enzyme E2 O